MRCLHTGKLPTKMLRDASLKRKEFVPCPTCGRICRPGPNGNLPRHNVPRDHRELRINVDRIRNRKLITKSWRAVVAKPREIRMDSPTLANYLKALDESS